jgi:type IV pilus assembly protein PilY1
VYAIDISTPSSTGLDTSAIKWDYNYKSVIGSDSTTAPKLGYTFGKPVIGRLGDNNWYAFFPNGTDSNDDKARVFVIRLGDAATALNVHTLEVTDGASKTSPNGMMVIQARVDSARTIKAIYGGDMRGNIWKFDLSGITSGSSAWPSTVATPLFTATTSGVPTGSNRQAITGGMRLGEYPGTTDTIVYFGTGKYFENVDKLFNASTSKPLFDSFYAVLDKGTSGLNKTQLTAQTFTAEGTNTRTATATAWDNSKFGWYIDLKLATAANGKGERVLTQPLLYGGRIIFVSMFPAATDPCNSTGTSWLNELDALSGSQITEDGHGVLDTNGNGVIDSGDAVIASVKVEGMASEPSVIQNAAGQEFKVMGSTSSATPIRSIAESTPPGVGLPGGAGRMSWTQLQ